MAATLKEIRAAIGDVLEANIVNPPIQVYRRVGGNLNVPCIVVMPATTDYLVTYNRGGDLWEFDLHILTPSADEDVGQDLLDEYVAGTGDRSVVSVIHQNKQLGLTGVEAHVARMTNYGFRFEVIQVPHIGATLRAQVLVTN